MQQGCAATEGIGKPPNPFVNSFLNLCRVCPVPTDDKVNSEYKRNFTWHDGYQATKVDVIRNAPSVPASSEAPLPGKRHYPLQQHSSHLLYDDGGESSDSLDMSGHPSLEHDSRARSEERNNSKSRASPRSRSADSTISRRLKVTAIPDEDLKLPSRAVSHVDTRKSEEKEPLMSQSYPPGPEPEHSSGIPKTTEYRSQFVAWPRPPGESCVSTARKSASMGLIAKKQDLVDGQETPSGELWNNAAPDENDDDATLDAFKRGRMKKTEYKAKFRPFSAYTYVDGSWKKATRLIKDRALDDLDIYSSFSYPFLDGDLTTDGEPPSEADQNAWYSEVVERLKKADQYRVRGHAGSSEIGTPDGMAAGRAVLSPVSIVSFSARTWKDDRPAKGRPSPAPVHHRKTDAADYPKSREGSTKRRPQVEKTTVRPKSAEPVIPVAKPEHKSPKRTRPRAPRDLPVHGHGDLSGRKKAYRLQQSAERSSPSGGKPRAVSRSRGEDGGKVWLKPDSSKEGKEDGAKEGQEVLVNGFGPEEHLEEDSVQTAMTGDDQPQINGEHTVLAVMKPPMKVPLTTVKSPEEVTGVRSPDPESWTVPLEIGKGLHWMDGKTPDGVQAKGPPTLLQKRLKESSLVGKSPKDIVVCDPGSENTGESVDL